MVGPLVDDPEELVQLHRVERRRSTQHGGGRTLDAREQHAQLMAHHVQELCAQPVQFLQRRQVLHGDHHRGHFAVLPMCSCRVDRHRDAPSARGPKHDLLGSHRPGGLQFPADPQFIERDLAPLAQPADHVVGQRLRGSVRCGRRQTRRRPGSCRSWPRGRPARGAPAAVARMRGHESAEFVCANPATVVPPGLLGVRGDQAMNGAREGTSVTRADRERVPRRCRSCTFRLVDWRGNVLKRRGRIRWSGLSQRDSLARSAIVAVLWAIVSPMAGHSAAQNGECEAAAPGCRGSASSRAGASRERGRFRPASGYRERRRQLPRP